MIQTAAGLFRAQGYHATGLNQVLAEGGLPKGSLYFHFPGGKDQLVVEATRAAVEETTAALRETLAVLPERQREAIVLRYYAELSEAEIAEAMGVSRGAVKSHAARGMAALRGSLEHAP